MNNYQLYDTGDEVYVRVKIEKAEVFNGRIAYKVQGVTELLPHEMICSDPDVLNDYAINLAKSLKRAIHDTQAEGI